MGLKIFWARAYQAAISSRHRFPMGKYGRLLELVSQRPWSDKAEWLTAKPATSEQASLAHDPGYIQRLRAGQLSEAEVKAIGLPQSASVTSRAFSSAGGTLGACRAALEGGAACSLAGGSHHAGPKGGRGFCVMNDVGVGLSSMLADGLLESAFVLDLDVHQGDGTAEIFAGQNTVFTASIHGENNYPFQKAKSDFDLGLADGTGDTGYLAELDRSLMKLEGEAAARQLLVYNAGVDAHAADRLGRLSLSDEGLAARDALVFDWAKSLGKPLCLVLGGGYDSDINIIAERHAQVFDRLAHAFLH